MREEAGERYNSLELSSLTIPRLTDNVKDTLEALATQMQTTRAVVEAMPGTLVGSLEALIDKLEQMRGRFDISYPVIPGAAIDVMAPVVARLSNT